MRRAVLIVAAILLFFSRLDCPLLEPEETRYAEIPRQMLVEDRWLVPVFHGQAYYDKPPLLYWLVMASYSIFGVHDWAARLVPSTVGVACVLATYWWGKHAVGARAALAGAFILCLSARFVYLGRMVTMNGLLSLCVLLALGAGQRALSGPTLRWHWWLASAAACSLGILAKGPVALVLILVPLFVYQLWDRSLSRPRVGEWLAYGFASLAIASPWFVAVALRDPGFVSYFVWTHHVLRYVAPLDHEQPFWYYLPGLLLGMLPWTLLLPGFLTRCWDQRPKWRQPGPAALFVIAFLWCLIFHSAAGCKRSGYILPAMPLLALSLGWYLDRLLSRDLEIRRWGILARRETWLRLGTCTFGVLLIGVLLLLPIYARRFSLREQVTSLAGTPEPFDVICYPHRWDSVNYYLQRDDVRAYQPGDRRDLVLQLSCERSTLAFIKSDRSLGDFLADLPKHVEFSPCIRGSWVTVGWITPKKEIPRCSLCSPTWVFPMMHSGPCFQGTPYARIQRTHPRTRRCREYAESVRDPALRNRS